MMMQTGLFRVVVLALALVVGTSLVGCNADPTRTRPVLNPQPLQRFPTPDKIARESAGAATTRQVQAYYSALQAAENNPKDTTALNDYRDAGIALVNSYCRSWFTQLDDSERNLSQKRSHHGVLTALGTALIGVSKLDADVTTVFGALNTAYTGALDSTARNYLFSASSTTVETKVFKHLNGRADEIRANTPSEFGQLRNVLEGYERICTFKHAAALVEQSVHSTETKVDENGAIKAVEFGTDESSFALRVLWIPDGVTVDGEFEKFANKWINCKGFKQSLPTLIYGAPYGDQRRALLADYAKSRNKATTGGCP